VVQGADMRSDPALTVASITGLSAPKHQMSTCIAGHCGLAATLAAVAPFDCNECSCSAACMWQRMQMLYSCNTCNDWMHACGLVYVRWPTIQRVVTSATLCRNDHFLSTRPC